MQHYYEELEIGDEVGPPVDVVIRTDRVVDFVGYWREEGLDARFTSDEQARKMGLEGAIVPGVMTMAHLSKLLTDWSDGVDLKLLDVIFRQPVFHNMPLTLHGLVTDKRIDGGAGTIEADLYADSPEHGRRITGRAVFTLPLRSS